MQAITNYLKKLGLDTMGADTYSQIDAWRSWYSQDESDFHSIKFYNGLRVRERGMYSLGMAKTVCEDWASLLMNEKVEISLQEESQDKALQTVLNDNHFRTEMNRLVELYMAMGTGAVVEYIRDGKVQIDFVRADMVYPLDWENGRITACAFGAYGYKNGREFIRLQIHLKNREGFYEVHNKILVSKDKGISYEEDELPPNVVDVYETKSTIPLFQIVRPNIVNNFDLNSPMGLAVFANALNVLQEIDLTFDAFKVEIETGRRMVFLASDLFYSDENGDMHNVISDSEDILRYVGDVGENATDKKIHDYTPDLRVDQIKAALQFQLNLLSEKCGMGTNRYEFTAAGTKTATEVISEDSDLYQTLKKHEIILEEGLIGMIKAIGFLSGFEVNEDEITIVWDDSIIEDADKNRQNAMQEVAAGLLSPVMYRMKIYGETEEEALKALDAETEIVEENSQLKNLPQQG